MHTSCTLTHTYGHRCTSTVTIIQTSKHIYANTHKLVSTSMHKPTHMPSCTRTCARVRARAHTHTHTHTHWHSRKITYTPVRER